MPSANVRLDAVVLRTGPSSTAVLEGSVGAPVFLQLFRVLGQPTIDDNGTPTGTLSEHGYTSNHRADDFVVGITFEPLLLLRGGHFPGLPPTTAGDNEGALQYLRWDLSPAAEPELSAGRYAFMVGFDQPGEALGFTLANRNLASDPAPPGFGDDFPGGFGIRREGDGRVPPLRHPGAVPDEALQSQSRFPSGIERYLLSPGTDGYPDVDTYRDLEVYIEVH